MTRPILPPGFLLGLMLLCCSLAPLRAEQFGSFTYRVVAGNTVEITRYRSITIGPITIPETIGGRPVTSIGYNSFFLCTGLTSITIPSSVIKIGPSAFNNCSGLITLTLSTGITTISDSMFLNCNALTSLTLPANVTSIGNSAFFGCHRLASMVLPDSVTKIGDDAFTSCLELTSLTLSSSLTSIGSDAFNSCRALIEITIPSSVTLIGSFAFKNCVSLKFIRVDPGSAHFSSAGAALFNAGQTALIACAGGKAGSFTLPSSVDRIAEGAFCGCSRLDSILVEPENTRFTTLGGALFNTELTTIVAYPAGLAGTYILPAGVTTIERYAFSGCNGMTSLALSDNLNIIKNHAFEFCFSLSGLTLPEGITSIGSYAFRGCLNLTSLTLPSSLTWIGSWAFLGCRGLTEITLSSSLNSIGEGWFSGCTGLTHFTVPSSVATIGPSAFSGCTGLSGIGFPSSLTAIQDAAFHRCSGLTSLTLPSGLISIGSSAFDSCSGLTHVTIPSTVVSLKNYAFQNCSRLGMAAFLGNAPPVNESVFYATLPGFTIYYLSGRTGFTSPAWNGSPATMIDETTWPAASWLMTYGLSYDTDLHGDPDSDGVNLLMAYALNLDPRLNLQDSFPVPSLGANALSLSFHATSPGITYRVETSTDLQIWTTRGVTLSAPDVDHQSTASVPRDIPSRYLRLVVED